MNAHNTRDDDGDLVADPLDCDRSRLVDFDLSDTPQIVRFFPITYTPWP